MPVNNTLTTTTDPASPVRVVATAGTIGTIQRQASVLAVFGFVSLNAAVNHYTGRWDAEHPNEPLDPGALAHGLRADMNEALPEPFSLEYPDTGHITGPDLANLPVGWAATARKAFRSMDLHLEEYTRANVRAWRAAGNGGYPWNWQPTNPNPTGHALALPLTA